MKSGVTLAVAIPLLLVACTPAPTYQRPSVETPLHWEAEPPQRETERFATATRETLTPEVAARETETPGAESKGSRWWSAFGDVTLNSLEERALVTNQDLATVEARLLQARALVQVATAGSYPRLDVAARGGRQRLSPDRPTYNESAAPALPQNDFTLGLAVSWEPDLFGRVATEVESSEASAQQARAELENARLLLTADLASTYFGMRTADAEIAVVGESIAAQTRAMELLEAKHSGGATSGLDVAQQQALLDTTRTQVELLNRQRLQYEHALATLVGVPAPRFSVPAATREVDALPTAPALPVAVPSELLARRPDIVGAERALAAANAQIGVARTAFFPTLTLGAGSGLESRAADRLLLTQNAFWSFGAALTWNLFEGGRTDARVQASRAAYQASVAAYQQTVLRAFQEVEDSLGAFHSLSKARALAEAAVVSTQRVLEIATDRYAGGAATYLEVVTAQQNMLGNQRLAAQLRGQQLATTAFLAKALGGGFETAYSAGRP